MTPIILSKQAARRIILDAQLLNGKSGAEPGKAGLRRIIDRLGYIQIDTIHIVERAHHHVLWTRQPGYAPAMLHDLQAGDRAVFEYWAHAMAYLPISDYRFVLYRHEAVPRQRPSLAAVPRRRRAGFRSRMCCGASARRGR